MEYYKNLIARGESMPNIISCRRFSLNDAAALSNEKVLENLRDGLPFPYTEKDAAEYITAMREI